MKYGICALSIVPVREETSDPSEQVNQLLYGDLFKITDERKNWFRVRSAHDGYEGWIDRKQAHLIDKDTFERCLREEVNYSQDLVDHVELPDGQLLTIVMGSATSRAQVMGHRFDGLQRPGDRTALVDYALMYLNAPYLWGGKSPFGIDCSGYTQMVYKLAGVSLMRDASQQATQGEALSFIEESEPGDLAFFDNSDGNITHVGIILEDHHIIHAHGKVRIDRIDHSGIFNRDQGKHTHKLRVIKRII